MNLVISSDLGHDADDFFAICYLAAAGYKIRALVLTPGDPDQIAIAQFLIEELQIPAKLGVSKLNREKLSSGSIHHELLRKYKRGLAGKANSMGKDVLREVYLEYPDCEAFIIGPPTNFGGFLKENPDIYVPKLVMQGGFLSYNSHNFATHKSDKMIGQDTMPTFNMNGDPKATHTILSANIGERYFVGKNVCHTVLFTKERLEQFAPAQCRASELFMEAAQMYFAKHQDKKWHDPTASLALNHGEVFDFVRGNPYNSKGKWGTQLDPDGAYIAANVNYEKIWEYIGGWQ